MPDVVTPAVTESSRPAWQAMLSPSVTRPHQGGVLVTALVVAVLVAVAVVLLTRAPECDIRDEMGTTIPGMRSGDEA